MFADDFSTGLAGWRALTGSLSEWTTTSAEFTYVSVDSRAQPSGRYLTPVSSVVLPDAYELRARVRVEAVTDSPTVSLLIDLRQPDALTRDNLAAQLAGWSAVQISRPLTTTLCRGATPQWGFEGVERGWFSEFQGGAGRLQGCRGVLDGSPKDAHYPYHPGVGDIGHSEGWVTCNAAWNVTLAWRAVDATTVRVVDAAGTPRDRVPEGTRAAVRLTAPLNLDVAALNRAEVHVRVGERAPRRLVAVQDAPNATTYTAELDLAALGATLGDTVTVSYGFGYFAHETTVSVTAPRARGLPSPSLPGPAE